ncbi:MAG: tripartite tricarboxylate transporter TctB family protein [Pleomorphochaeta sp.]
MEKKKICKEIAVGLTIVAISLFVALILIPNQIALSNAGSESSSLNTRSFPYLATGLIGFSALIHSISYFFKYLKLEKEPKENESIGEKMNMKAELKALLVFVLFLVYGILFDKFGFVISSLIIPPLVLFSLGSRNKYHYISIYTFNILIFLIFQFLLNIPLIR